MASHVCLVIFRLFHVEYSCVETAEIHSGVEHCGASQRVMTLDFSLQRHRHISQVIGCISGISLFMLSGRCHTRQAVIEHFTVPNGSTISAFQMKPFAKREVEGRKELKVVLSRVCF